MITPLFEYPPGAAFGRILPKGKIYEHSAPGTAVKTLFIRQTERIVWQYKLAPETINLKGTPAVPEIQIFSIFLKENDLAWDVLHCIDRAIPFPLYFELHDGDRIKAAAAFKRPSDADGSKWVISSYFTSDWISTTAPRRPLPLVFDLETLYARLLMPLMPFPARSGETLPALMERMEQVRVHQRELEKCKIRLRREKQFNRKVAINAELRELQQEFEGLIQ